MPDRMPTVEEWEDWLQHPCTKRLRFWAQQGRQGLMEGWAKGNFAAAFTMEMAVKNAGATGACSVYELVNELDYELIVIGASDEGEESVRVDSPGAGSVGGTV